MSKENEFYKDNDPQKFCGGGCTDLSKVNKEKYETGATIEGIQTAYFPASEVCETLDTLVPNAMALEQRKFNQYLKTAVQTLGMSVEEWVAKKLHYKNVEELCYEPDRLDSAGRKIVRFSVEQIDAIATAIFNYENGGEAIIIADQTGVGKGRQAAGILRYAFLELKATPIFFTEKKHLINDIYRDLIAIGFEAGVPKHIRKRVKIDVANYTDADIIKEIKKDLKENEEMDIEYSFPDWWSDSMILKGVDEKNEHYDEVEAITEEVIALYRQKFLEDGAKDVYEAVPYEEYESNVRKALKEGKFLVQPFVPYSNLEIKDVHGNIIYDKIDQKEIQQIYKYRKVGNSMKPDPSITKADLSLPDKFKIMAIPYSQMGRAFYDTPGGRLLHPKIALLQKLVESEKGAVMVLDESHTASGLTSITGQIMAPMIKQAKMVTYLSATYAKRPDNMPLYALRTSIRESGLSDDELIDVFRAGKNALQEAVSAELTRNGQLLRREKLIQGKTHYHRELEGTQVGDQQIVRLDRVATMFRQVDEFAGKVRESLNNWKSENCPTKEDKAKYKPGRGVNSMSFLLFNFMLLGLKVKQTSQKAIEELRAGRKTVITLSNTMESALDNMSKTFMSNVNADSYKIGDTIKNDFQLYMAYLLNYTMRWTEVKQEFDEELQQSVEKRDTVYVLDSSDEVSQRIHNDCFGEYKRILNEILSDEAATGIPIAPIDMIKKNIADNGFKINEITGRQRCITFDNGETSEGTIEKREITKTEIVVRAFNENELDCLLINQSGAVGISMHALPNDKVNIIYPDPKDSKGNPILDEDGVAVDGSPTSLENKKEVKKRAMIVTQMDLDINKEVQKLGRINRTGQVYQPVYHYIISAIPSEARLTALMEQKLRSLSANVSADQEQSAFLFSFDDFFSDEAVPPCVETIKDMGPRIRVRELPKTGEDIRNLTKALYFAPFAVQKEFYDTFQMRLKAYIEHLDSLGLYKGKMTHKDYYAETYFSFPFFIGDNNAKTSFGRHSFIEKCSVKLYREKNTENKITQYISDYRKLKNKAVDEEAEKVPGYVSEDTLFKSTPAYQTAATKKLDEFEKEKKEQNGRINEKALLEVKEQEAKLKEAVKSLAQFKDLEKAIELEKQVKESDEKMKAFKLEMTDKMMSDDVTVDEMKKFKSDSETLASAHKILTDLFEPLKEILGKKDEQKVIERAIKNLQGEIESNNKSIERRNRQTAEYSALIVRTKDYLGKIGQVFDYSISEESFEYGDEGDSLKPTKAIYTEVYKQPSVLVGVTFPYSGWDLTPGKVEIHLAGVSQKSVTNLYKLHKDIDPEMAEIGTQPLEKIIFLEKDYKDDIWNAIAGKVDVSYREDRYIIVGSLPRTYSLSKANGYNGQIIKYNTIDGKTKLGIEIADSSSDDENTRSAVAKTVYKILSERYNPETAVQYPIYYDGNAENVNRFITDYIYYAMFGRFYEAMEKSKGNNSDEDFVTLDRWANEFSFQMTSKDREMFVVVKPSQESVRDSEIMREHYNDKTFKKVAITADGHRQLWEQNERANLEFSVQSADTSAVEAFAYFLEKKVGTEITNANYQTTAKQDKNPLFKGIDQYRHGQYIHTFRPRLGQQFKTFFPTNLIRMEEYMNYGLRVSAILKMTFNDFIALMTAFEGMRRKPTFATASEYFERHKGSYVFEQFNDEFAKPEMAPTGLQFVSEEEKANTEIDLLIESLKEMVITIE